MNCVFNSKQRSTCWRGYNYCKHLKTANIQGGKPLTKVTLSETEVKSLIEQYNENNELSK